MIGRISYGELELDLTHIEDLQRRPVMSDDGTTLKHVEWRIRVMCLFNPGANSFRGGDDRKPVPAPGEFAGTTDAAIRAYLAYPRRQLKILHGDRNGDNQPWLVSPKNDPATNKPRPTDCLNGPIISDINVTEHHGTRTWIVHCVIVTYVRDCDAPTPIISHRFRQSVTIDQDYFSTVTTQGVVEFDVGRLWQANQTPDEYRSQFFVPLQSGLTRELINIEVSDDNASARYTLVDRSRAFQLGFQSPATRCESYLTTWYKQGALIPAAAQATSSIWTRLFSAAQQISLDPVHDVGVAISTFGGAAGDVIGVVNANAPKYYASIVVRAWGSKTSKRLELFNMCMGIAVAKLGSPDFLTRAANTEIIVTQEVTGKYVEVTMTLRWADEVMLALIAAIANRVRLGQLPEVDGLNVLFDNLETNGSRFFTPFVAAPEAVPNIPGSSGSLSLLPAGNRYPLAGPTVIVGGNEAPDANARSADYIRKLVTNGLSAQCHNPPVVGQVDPAVRNA